MKLKKGIIIFLCGILFLQGLSLTAAGFGWYQENFGGKAEVSTPPGWHSTSFGGKATVTTYTYLWSDWSAWWTFTVSNLSAPTNFSYLNATDLALNLSWTKGIGANNTYIERNTTMTWDIGEGILVYNDTGEQYNDTGLDWNTTYYYQLWSYRNWTYSPKWANTYLSGTAKTSSLIVDPPYNASFEYNTTTDNLTLSWSRGNYSDQELLVSRNDTYATSPNQAGNWVRQNNTNTSWTGIVTQTIFFTAWSWNNSAGIYSLEKLNMVWGAFIANVMDENYPWIAVTDYTLFITNVQGTETYYATNLNNPTELSYAEIPYGNNTIIQISHPDYEPRVWYVDLAPSLYYNYTFYIPRKEAIEEGNGTDCVTRSYTDSVSVLNHSKDVVINLSFTIEDIISVEIYNESLYGTYGGWLFISADNYDVYSTNVTVSSDVLDENTTMARVSYYYEDCEGIISPAIYYIRIVETYETSAGIFERAIEGAKVDFQRYINTTDEFKSISILLTDANGYVNLYLIPGVLYKVVITKDGYVTKRADYTPAPANEFGQTSEKTFRIVATETPDEEVEEIKMDILTLGPYNTTTMRIYYLNLNEDNSYVNFSIYDAVGDSLLKTYNVTVNPDNISILFNFSTYNLSGDVLKVVSRSVRINGTSYTMIKYFNVNEARRLADTSLAPIAAIFSVGICLFGLTIAHPKKVFGFVGIITMVIAIAITTVVQQTWYLHLLQAIELILLIVTILIFREEGVHAV